MTVKYPSPETSRGLEKNVCAGYQFVWKHWTPGAQIILVGFSRGGFNVQTFAAFLSEVGMNPRHLQTVPRYKLEGKDELTGEDQKRMAKPLKELFAEWMQWRL